MTRSRALVAVPALALFASAGLLIAGPLNPSAGPVTSTYKTLTEVEPRTAINAVNTPGNANCLFRITQPGSYYLTGNIAGQAGKNGIQIESAGVSLDLNGFRVSGVDGALFAIVGGAGAWDLSIRNGAIVGWTSGGVEIATGQGPVIIESVRVSQGPGTGIRTRGPAVVRGCTVDFVGGVGIDVFEYGTVTDCAVSSAGGDGFSGGTGVQFTNCTATNCTGDGFSVTGTMRGCTASWNAQVGILAGFGSTVTDCTSSHNGGDGIRALGNSTISRCVSDSNLKGIRGLNGVQIDSCNVSDNDLDGIELGTSSTATNNLCRRNGTDSATAAGILATGVANRIDSNSVFENDYGVRIASSDNLVTRNSARNNAAGNFSFVVAGETAQILLNPGANFVATNPWANFAY